MRPRIFVIGEWSQSIAAGLATTRMKINERINNAALHWWMVWKIKFCYKIQAFISVNYPNFKDASCAPSLTNSAKTSGFSRVFRNCNSHLVNQEHEYSLNVIFWAQHKQTVFWALQTYRWMTIVLHLSTQFRKLLQTVFFFLHSISRWDWRVTLELLLQ